MSNHYKIVGVTHGFRNEVVVQRFGVASGFRFHGTVITVSATEASNVDYALLADKTDY